MNVCVNCVPVYDDILYIHDNAPKANEYSIVNSIDDHSRVP